MSGWCQSPQNIPKGQKPHFHFNNAISADLVHFHCLCFAYYLLLDNGNSLWLSILAQLALTFCPQLLALTARSGPFAPKGLQ